jgi:uncharacterized membrane protein YqjE
MEEPQANLGAIADRSKGLARRLLTIGENRLELFMVEVQEERESLLTAILIALGIATFGLLAGMVVTAAIVVLFWNLSPAITLVVLALLYSTGAAVMYRRLTSMLRDWKSFPATLDQLRKDRACLEKQID